MYVRNPTRPVLFLWILLLCGVRVAFPSSGSTRPLTIFAAGDVLPGRGVTPALGSSSTTLFQWRREISSADIAFCNLECSVATSRPLRKTQLLAAPDSLKHLQTAGFDVVSTANNHALDGGETGMRLLHRIVRQSNITPIGSRIGDGTWPAWRTVVRGRHVVWLAASAWGPFQQGSATVRPLARSGLIEQVRRLASAGDIIFVSLHWGHEYSRQPSAGQRRTARALVDAGAMAVIGHHPHVAQPIETYRGRPIFYSLGNFLFDRTPRPQNGIAALIAVDAARKVSWRTFAVQPMPVKKSRWSTPPTPRTPSVRGEKIMARLKGLFLLDETKSQLLIWSKLPNGTHRLRLLRRKAYAWQIVAQGFHASIYDLQRGDMDGDGRDDILVGLNQRSKLDTTVRRRLHIYGVEARRGFRPRWRGSALSRPFSRFALLPRHDQRGCDLVALEKNSLPLYRDFAWITIYRWNGFGFRVLWDTPVRGEVLGLHTGRDRSSSYIRFVQVASAFKRTLTLRPVPNAKGEAGFKAVVETI